MPKDLRDAIDAVARRRSRRGTLSVGRRALCDYVADMTSEFGQLAKSHDLRFLSYLLAMVVEEAVHQSQLAADSESAPPVAARPSNNPEN
jgi:hypothetical protein